MVMSPNQFLPASHYNNTFPNRPHWILDCKQIWFSNFNDISKFVKLIDSGRAEPPNIQKSLAESQDPIVWRIIHDPEAPRGPEVQKTLNGVQFREILSEPENHNFESLIGPMVSVPPTQTQTCNMI